MNNKSEVGVTNQASASARPLREMGDQIPLPVQVGSMASTLDSGIGGDTRLAIVEGSNPCHVIASVTSIILAQFDSGPDD
jgi:hypothetical protein